MGKDRKKVDVKKAKEEAKAKKKDAEKAAKHAKEIKKEFKAGLRDQGGKHKK